MGKATIVSEYGSGRYRVQPVIDATRATAEISRLGDENTAIDTRLTELTSEINTATLDVDYQQQVLDAAISGGDEDTIRQAQAALREATRTLLALTGSEKYLNLKKTANQKRIAWLQQEIADPSETDAWCADLSEGLTGTVGTIEIGREATTPIIRPGATSIFNGSRDGALQPLASSSPSAVFFNAAVKAGAAKWKPRYRTGVASNVDTGSNTMTVTLDAVSIDGVNCNQSSVLNNVTVDYMTCNASAFEDGDDVVVEFTGQDWSSPQVIGFVDNPQPCVEVNYWYICRDADFPNDLYQAFSVTTASYTTEAEFPQYKYINETLPDYTQIFGDLLLTIDPPDTTSESWLVISIDLDQDIQTTLKTYTYDETVRGVCFNATRRFYAVDGDNYSWTDGDHGYFGYSGEIEITDHSDTPVASISLQDSRILSIACSDSRLAVCHQIVHEGRILDNYGDPIPGTKYPYYTVVVDFYDNSGTHVGRLGTVEYEVSDSTSWNYTLYGGPAEVLGYGYSGSSYPSRVDVMQPTSISESHDLSGVSASVLDQGMIVDDLLFAVCDPWDCHVWTRATTGDSYSYSHQTGIPAALVTLPEQWYHARIERTAV